MVTANPDIYGVDSTDNLKEVQKRAKEGLENLSSQQMLEQLEAKVKLNSDVEKKKNTLRTINYALDPNRKGNVDMGDGKGPHLVASKDFYENLTTKLKDKPGYTPPADKEAKVFYDISFRLKQLGFDKNSKGEKLNFTNEYNNDFAIAVMAFQKMSGAKKIESIVGPETLWKLLQDDTFVPTVIESNPPVDYSSQNVVSPIIEQQVTLDNSSIENTDATINKQSQSIKIHYTSNNLTKEQEKRFLSLETSVNDNDEGLLLFLGKFLQKFTETTTNSENKKVRFFEGNAEELFYEFVEGYTGSQNKSKKERLETRKLIKEGKVEKGDIQISDKFNTAFEYAITSFLADPTKTSEQKDWLVLFVKSFTNSYDKLLPQVTSYKLKKISNDNPLTLK